MESIVWAVSIVPHESKNNILARYEYFFITPNGKLATYFKSQKPFSVEYLSNKTNIFLRFFTLLAMAKKLILLELNEQTNM